MFLAHEVFIKWKAFAMGSNATTLIFMRVSTWRSMLAFCLLMANLALAAESAPKKHLIVGSELDFPPFALVREGGRAEGFTAELWRAVAREADLETTIKTGPFHEILEQFKSGQIDVLINLAQSDERRRFADFSVPHVKMAGAVFTRKGDSRIKSEEDLAGKSLIVLNADLAHDYAVMRGWSSLTLVDTVASGMKLLAASTKYDAMLVGRLVGLNTIKELLLDNLQPLHVKVGFQQDFAFAVRKGNADLLARLNDGLANVRASGAYDAIYSKWFGGLEPAPLTMESILKYLIAAAVVLLLLTFAYLRERTLRIRSKESASALDATIESTADGILVLTLDGRVAHCNRRFLELWRVPAALAAMQNGKEVLRLVLEQLAEPDGFLAKVQQLSDPSMAETFDLLHLKDGRYYECVSKPQIIEQRAVGRVWSFRDVSDGIRAENALRENAAHLQAILDSEPQCVKLLDRDCRLLDMNPAGLAMIAAQSVDQVRGCNIMNLLAPQFHQEYRQGVEAVFRGERTFQSFEVVGLDGQRHWMEQHAVPLWEMGKSGRVKQMLAVTHDITERQRAEEQLRAARDELELRVADRTAELTRTNALLREKEELLMLSQRAGHTGLWSRDLATGMSSMSPEWRELMGFPVGDTPVSFAEFLDRVHPDDRERVKEMRSRQKIGDFDSEFRIVHPVKGERWILSRGRRGISTADGHLHMMGALIDISERKQAEEALCTSQERLQHALAVGHMGTWERDMRTEEVTWDDGSYQMYGFSKNTAVSRDLLSKHVHPADLPVVNDVIRRSRVDGTDFECEFRFLRPDGKTIWVSTHGGTRRDANGVPTHMAGINYEITERKAAEEALRNLNEQLDQRVAQRTQQLAQSRAKLRALVAELTKAEERERRRLAVELHDYLAQSLTATRMNLSRADKFISGANGNSELTEILNDVHSDLTDSINYTRSLIAAMSPRVLYDLGLPAALGWLGEQMGRHGLRVEVDGPRDGLPLAEDDAVFLFQCARELLWNVVKHGDTNRATVAFGRDGNRVSLAVIDDGKGFDPQAAQEGGNGGTHLGLFSIRERVALRGGRVEIDSMPGDGTWVTIILPVDVSEEVSSMTAQQKLLEGVPGESVRIVIVDDHKMVRQGLRRVLEEHSDFAIVGEAGDGAEAIAMTRELEPHVVIMDVNLPTMSGIDATQGIIRERPSTIVIGLSFGSDSYVSQAMQTAGAVTCIAKERAVEEVRQAILDAVAGRWLGTAR